MRSTENSSFIRDQDDVDCAVTGNAWQVRVVSIDKVTQRRARLVLGWVTTVFVHLGRLCNQPPPRPTQPPTLSGTGSEYRPKVHSVSIWGMQHRRINSAPNARHADWPHHHHPPPPSATKTPRTTSRRGQDFPWKSQSESAVASRRGPRGTPYPCRPLPRTSSVLQFFQGPHGVTDPTRPTDKVRTCRDWTDPADFVGGTASRDSVAGGRRPPLFSTGGTRPPLSPTFLDWNSCKS